MTMTKLSELLVDPQGQSLWPNAKMEAWKYFDFKQLKLFADCEASEMNFSIEVDPNSQDTILFTSQKCQISKNLVDLGLIYELKDCSESLIQSGKLDHRFQKVNLQFKQVYLKFKDLKLDKKIEIKHQSADLNSGIYAPSIFLDLENSDLSIIESVDFKSLSSQGFNSILSQAQLKASNLRHFVSQDGLSSQQALMYFSEATLSETSTYKIFLSTLNCTFVRNQNGVHMKDPGSQGEILSFVLGGEKSYVESRTEIAHYAESCESRQLFKSIISDQAKTIFNGRIYVDSKAQKTDSSQTCKGLLLSEKAQMNAKPELEIYADDVKAAHGAAIGQVSKNELFYLLSRGISPDKAYELLAQAFAGEVINEIKDKDLRNQIEKKIRQASAPIFEDLVKTYKQTYQNVGPTKTSSKES